MPVLRSDGTYTVKAVWGASPTKTVNGYALSVTRDGQKFDPSTSVTQAAADYNRIPAGTFGLKVAAKDENGTQSEGIEKVITLPASGVGLLGILAASGFGAGQRAFKRRKKVVG